MYKCLCGCVYERGNACLTGRNKNTRVSVDRYQLSMIFLWNGYMAVLCMGVHGVGYDSSSVRVSVYMHTVCVHERMSVKCMG